MEPQNNHLPPIQDPFPRRLIIAVTGASGAILGIRLLQALKPKSIETHLVLSESSRITILHETDWQPEDVLSLADVSYDCHDIGASIASGSFSTMGMVIIPCSIKTLSAVANSYTDDLISRAADVTLKEGRLLVLVVRETPYHPGHLHLMTEASQAGAIIYPPIPAFYMHPRSVNEIIDNTVGRILFRLGVENDLYQEWNGKNIG